jgi:hypothetical protein
MRMNVPRHSGIEVSGRVIPAALEAFGDFTVLAGQLLMANGVGKPDRSGFIRVDTEGWYPLDGYLKTYQEIVQQFGPKMVRKLGGAQARHALFPPTIVDITTAMQSMDVGFHMNHRQHGRIMFDGITGVILEGIGHYHCVQALGQKRIQMRCDNPYPCAFDQGFLEELARRFIPQARLEHETPSNCRSKGAPCCTYLLTWKDDAA